jgi:hypothetical protein
LKLFDTIVGIAKLFDRWVGPYEPLLIGSSQKKSSEALDTSTNKKFAVSK